MDKAAEEYQFATSLLAAFYGPSSVHLAALKDYIETIYRSQKLTNSAFVAKHCEGVISSTMADIKAGLTTNFRGEIQGEVLGDLIAIAKETLNDKADSATNVAAVLTAAAFEDVLRRLAVEKAAITGRPKLEHVVSSLKDADVLKGGEITTAISYLKFRNDSLHADWTLVYRTQVEGCLNFVESLLLKHFS